MRGGEPGRIAFATAAAVAAVALWALWAAASREVREDFPHEAHAGLFPLCAGCHVGVESGAAAEVYPDPESCAACHDGVELARVAFTVPVPEPSNLSFDHLEHARAVASIGEAPTACASCHAPEEAPRMTVEPLEAGRCLTCHAPPGADHVVDAPCTACHVPLAESGLPVERIAALAVPADHESGRFVREIHGPGVTAEAARCATCHTQDRCVACHVDAGRPEIALLPPAPAGMLLPPAAAHYPVPDSHRSAAFQTEHGRLLEVGGAAACATCHTRDDCASCHLPPLPGVAGELPPRSAVLAPGAGLVHEAPASHRAPRFVRAHGTLAASDPEGCATCHTQPFCVECHRAPQAPGYHDPDFVARHSADAWSGRSECATCHEVQVFCRSCHLQVGFGAEGRLGPGFHDAEPVWLLRHGQAARQSLDGCASCHAQRDCMQCHSEIGAFRVSPHGPGFDARRAWQSNPRMCFACHVSPPLG